MTRPAFVSPLDSLVGDGIEAAVQLKHQVRRRRLGWSHALNPSDERAWAAGDPPPRTGCSLEVLVDGVGAFAAIAEAIENARHFVHIAGWHVAPHLALVRGDRPTVLSQIMSRLVLEPRPRPLELKPHVRAVTTKTHRLDSASTTLRPQPPTPGIWSTALDLGLSESRRWRSRDWALRFGASGIVLSVGGGPATCDVVFWHGPLAVSTGVSDRGDGLRRSHAKQA